LTAAIYGSVDLPLWKMKFTSRGKFTLPSAATNCYTNEP